MNKVLLGAILNLLGLLEIPLIALGRPLKDFDA